MPHYKIYMLGVVLLCSQSPNLKAQTMAPNNATALQKDNKLTAKEQAIVLIAAFTAKGNMPKLQQALETGLNLGLTVNEIKEVLVQLYAYAGFPRSLNALNNLMALVKDRKAKGIKDVEGREATPLPAERSTLQYGTDNQTKLVGRPISGELYQFAPAIDQFLKTHLFGDIFGRDVLDWKTREIATISALAAMGGVESQLQSHFGVGRYNGISEAALQQLVSIIRTNVGDQEGLDAAQVLQKTLAPASRLGNK